MRRLLAEGYRLQGIDVNPIPSGNLPAEVECIRAEITDRAALARCRARGWIPSFTLPPSSISTTPIRRLRDEYYRVNVAGTRAQSRLPMRQLSRDLCSSAPCAYTAPACHPAILAEDAPIRCDSWYGETKWEAEGIVLRQAPAVVLRLAAVYGLRMKGNYVRLLEALRRYRFLYVGETNRRTLVYDDDVAAAAVLAAEHPAALGQVYNVSDGRVHTFREIVEVMCQALGRRPPHLQVPVSWVRAGAGIAEAATQWLGRPPPLPGNS